MTGHRQHRRIRPDEAIARARATNLIVQSEGIGQYRTAVQVLRSWRVERHMCRMAFAPSERKRYRSHITTLLPMFGAYR